MKQQKESVKHGCSSHRHTHLTLFYMVPHFYFAISSSLTGNLVRRWVQAGWHQNQQCVPFQHWCRKSNAGKQEPCLTQVGRMPSPAPEDDLSTNQPALKASTPLGYFNYLIDTVIMKKSNVY